jgi:hypothetical protein
MKGIVDRGREFLWLSNFFWNENSSVTWEFEWEVVLRMDMNVHGALTTTCFPPPSP